MTAHVVFRIEVSAETGLDARRIAATVDSFAERMEGLRKDGFTVRVLREPRVVNRRTPAPELPLGEQPDAAPQDGATASTADPDDPFVIPPLLDRRVPRVEP